MHTLRDVINDNAGRYANKIAFKFGDKSYTFRQVNQRINSLINALSDMGIRKGDRVGILAYNCPSYFEMFGLAKAGRVCVPLNYRCAARELSYLINNSEIAALVLESEFVEVLKSIRHELKSVREFVCLDDIVDGMRSYEHLIESYPPDEPTDDVEPGDPCILFYTSGTTGQPKGAVHTHRSVMSDGTMPHRGLSSDDIVLCVMPFFHTGGSAAHLIPAFAAGATSIIHSKFDETFVLETIEKERVTYTFLVPSMILRLLEHPDLARYDLSSLHSIGYTGSPIPIEVLRRGVARLGQVFFQELGQTETLNMTVLRKEEHKLEGSPEELRRLESAGRPSGEGELRIVDDYGRDVPLGEPGEIVARSERVMQGYWRMPEETARVMRDGWLRTGDVGRMDEDGYVYLVDRKKDMIISGGENIYSREVEEVLYMHPAVLEAAVVGVPDAQWGEAVKAVVTLKPGAEVCEEEVIDFCKGQMASYKKPRSVEFWAELPKTASGKIRKDVIRERYWEGYKRKVH